MKKKALLTLCLTLATLSIHAQGPNGSKTYYQLADGKRGAALKTILHTIISKKKNSPSYDDLLELYEKTDTRPDGYVRDWYSNITHFTHIKDKAGTYKKEGDVYNREHTVPQSWGSPKSDIMHVVPTDGYVNNRRSNYPFGEVGTVTYSSANGYSKLGTCKTPGYSGTVFEPNDEVKGDIARIYFYMATCYEGTCHTWGNKVFTGTAYQPMAQWAFDMMLRWSKLDPVDDVEIARNNAIYQDNVQGNRNPFVDYPGLEDYIWGDKKEVYFSYDHYDSGDVDIVERVAQPVFSPAGGTYTDSVEVTITTATAGATIYYTVDGTDATTNSLLYKAPVKLKANTTLKAIAVNDTLKASYQATANYIIKESGGVVTPTDATIALNNTLFGTNYTGSISDKNDLTGTSNGITVVYSLGSGANRYCNNSQIRIYQGNQLTFSIEEGNLTRLEFTVPQNKDKTLQADNGTVTTYVWEGNAPSVTFSVNSGSGHIQLSSVKATVAVEGPAPAPKGDVNGDNTVDVADIAAIISYMAGLYGSVEQQQADVNNDKKVDVADIATVISIMAGR